MTLLQAVLRWAWMVTMRVIVFFSALMFPGYGVAVAIWDHFPIPLSSDGASLLFGLIGAVVSIAFWAGVRTTAVGRSFTDWAIRCALPPS